VRTQRIEGLTDGIFAIAMTLLVIDLRLPELGQAFTDGTFWQAVSGLASHFLSFALSFVILGILWIGHHNQMHYIRKADRGFLWLNIVFFMFISLVPFSASVLAAASGLRLASVLYALNLMAAGIVLNAIWQYALRHDLVEEKLDPGLVRMVTIRILMAPAFYVAAILSAVLLPEPLGVHLSHLLFILPLLIYFFPASFDRWLR